MFRRMKIRFKIWLTDLFYRAYLAMHERCTRDEMIELMIHQLKQNRKMTRVATELGGNTQVDTFPNTLNPTGEPEDEINLAEVLENIHSKIKPNGTN